MCFGGSSAPAAPAPLPPPPPPPPPQLARQPDAAAVRADTAAQNTAQGGGTPQTTLLTGGLGDASSLANSLGKKTLLGQ